MDSFFSDNADDPVWFPANASPRKPEEEDEPKVDLLKKWMEEINGIKPEEDLPTPEQEHVEAPVKFSSMEPSQRARKRVLDERNSGRETKVLRLEEEGNVPQQNIPSYQLPVKLSIHPRKEANRVILSRWEPKKWGVTPPPAPFHIERPPLTYQTLAAMAIANSPTGSVKPTEVYSFVLHHFVYYRYTRDNWKNSIRNALNKSVFSTGKFSGKGNTLYCFADTSTTVKRILKDEEWVFIKTNERGRDFYERVLDGNVGLPRHLFYHIVGLPAPWFAGPENSAIFYHLISLRKVPRPFTPMFREYSWTDHSGAEPFHCEEPSVYRMGGVELEDLKQYVNVFFNEETNAETSEQQRNIFHDNVELYFQLQKDLQNNNVTGWMTPSCQDVLWILNKGSGISAIQPVRDYDDIPMGSCYWPEQHVAEHQNENNTAFSSLKHSNLQ